MNPVFVDFPPSVATDVVEYRLYYVPAEQDISLSSPFVSVGNPPPVDGVISVDIAQIEEFQELDGNYDIGVAAVDDAGNVSRQPRVTENVPLDFVAPPAPASISVRFG